MVSPALIEQFVVPVTSKIGEELGPIRLHSCGPSTNHLKAFSKITNLYSLDLGGDTSIRATRRVFGKAMPISVAPLPNDMSAESTEPILRWAKQILEENNVAFCISDSAGRYPYCEAITADFIYIRLHGSKQLYASEYSEEELQEWAKKIREWNRDTHIYFDNDHEGYAVKNANRLKQILTSNPVNF